MALDNIVFREKKFSDIQEGQWPSPLGIWLGEALSLGRRTSAWLDVHVDEKASHRLIGVGSCYLFPESLFGSVSCQLGRRVHAHSASWALCQPV